MSNFTFLTEEQYFDNEIDVIRKKGTKAAITDFSILLGGYVSDGYHIDGNNSLEGRTGWYWTKSDDGDNDARAVGRDGRRNWNYVRERYGGARPALPFSSISNIPTNGVSGRRDSDGIYVVEYGYYPQHAVSRSMQDTLEQAYK